jgi:hypothetical protein
MLMLLASRAPGSQGCWQRTKTTTNEACHTATGAKSDGDITAATLSLTQHTPMHQAKACREACMRRRSMLVVELACVCCTVLHSRRNRHSTALPQPPPSPTMPRSVSFAWGMICHGHACSHLSPVLWSLLFLPLEPVAVRCKPHLRGTLALAQRAPWWKIHCAIPFQPPTKTALGWERNNLLHTVAQLDGVDRRCLRAMSCHLYRSTSI